MIVFHRRLGWRMGQDVAQEINEWDGYRPERNSVSIDKSSGI
jgi:hypothetical protein